MTGNSKGTMLQVEGWEVTEDASKCLRIRRRFTTKNFLRGLDLCDRIAEVAEAEGHHPDLHLTVSG